MLFKRIIALLLVSFLIYSCKPRIKNDTATLEEVFQLSKLDVVIHVKGCFSNDKEYFILSKKGVDYILKSKKTNRSHPIPKFKIDSLKNYLKNNISKNDWGGCSISEYIRIGSFFNSIDYEDSSCNGVIANLLDYDNLIKEQN